MIYILVPVFKRIDHTTKFIHSCETHIGNEKHFILVDDSREAEHVQLFTKKENVTILKGTGDLWWGGSVNKGMNYLLDTIQPEDKDILIIANNDVELTDRMYPILFNKIKHNENCFVHPVVFDQNNTEIKSSATLKSWIPLRADYKISPLADITPVNLVTARFMMSYYKNFKKIGLISHNLPHYTGDWDYGYRSFKLGVEHFLVKDARVIVDTQATGIKYENRMSLDEFWDALFINIKSPQNLKYKYQFFKNHLPFPIAQFALFVQLLKTVIKYISYQVKL